MKQPIGICVWCIPVKGIENAVQWAAQNGLQGIELDLGEEKDGYPLSQPEVQQQIAALGKRWNIAYPTLGVNALCTYGMSVAAHREKAKEALDKAVETARALHIPLLQLPSFVNGAIKSEEDFQNTVECLRYACQIAEGSDILIGSESALSTADQLRLVEEVGHPKLKLYFDTRNPFIALGCDVAGMLETVLPHVCEVHLKDGVDGGPSALLARGNSGFLRSAEVLNKNGYTGWVVLENNYHEIAATDGMTPDAAAAVDIALVKQL